MITQDFEKSLLALACWPEHESGLDVMLGIAHVIRNRVNAWSESFTEIIQSRAELSYLDDDDQNIYPDVRDPRFVRLLQSIDAVYDGRAKDGTDGSLYYANPLKITSEWFQTEILGQPAEHPMIAKIGSFYFFK